MIGGVPSSPSTAAPPSFSYPGSAFSTAGGDLKAADAATEIMYAWAQHKHPGLEAALRELEQDHEIPQWTNADLEHWYKHEREKSETTIVDRIRHLGFMSERYRRQLVMLHGTRYQFVITARAYYEVRKAEGAGNGALLKDLKCLKMLGRFLGINYEKTIWPNEPPQPQRSHRKIPTPEMVRSLLSMKFAKGDIYRRESAVEHAWVASVLGAMYGLGLRAPKEYWFLQWDWWNPATGILHVVEPKKRHKERDIFVEPAMVATSKRHRSLNNWMLWRQRIEDKWPGLSTRMFPNPLTGMDFDTPEAFASFLLRRVKPHASWFNCYGPRHWSVYARIIEGGFKDASFNAVAEWHGHERVDMTRDRYGPMARALSKSPAYGLHWLSRAFQKPPTRDYRARTRESLLVPPEAIDGSARAHSLHQERTTAILPSINGNPCWAEAAFGPSSPLLGVAA